MIEQKKPAKKWPWFKIWLFLLGGAALATIIPNVIRGFSESPTKCMNYSVEATYINSMNNFQQAYYLEKQTFAKDIKELGINIQQETDSFKFEIQSSAYKSFVYHYAIPKNDNYQGYVGAVFLLPTSETKEITTLSILCESLEPLSAGQKLPNPFLRNGILICPDGTGRR